MRFTRPGGDISHHIFRELPDLLRADDLLVFNNTRVVPARFYCRRQSGGRIEGLFLRQLQPGYWRVMLRNAGRCRQGEKLTMEADESISIQLAQLLGEGRYEVRVDPTGPAETLLKRVGTTPLPPYIHRQGGAGEDATRYQTVYSRQPGAVAAPTAGLHFTQALLDSLEHKGIASAYVTLHVGAGTFLPVKERDPRRHRMHSEQFELSPEMARRINLARSRGRRVVAVGTTVVRVLETLAGQGEIPPGRGETDIFLLPPASFRAVDALITNFHLPKSTLLMLVAAFCSPGSTDGIPTILDAYRVAQQEGYRFYSYGDAMLIE